jgi:hypothetical protein
MALLAALKDQKRSVINRGLRLLSFRTSAKPLILLFIGKVKASLGMIDLVAKSETDVSLWLKIYLKPQ